MKYLGFLVTFFTTIAAKGGYPAMDQDSHGCVLDGGYEWCESSQKCLRIWEEACPSLLQTDFCEATNIQMCRMDCGEPACPNGECAMRIGNCCDYSCFDNTLEMTKCPTNCPPPIPCPMPMIEENCHFVPPTPNNCGCQNSCGSVDCSQRNRVGENENCGGFMPYGICEDDLECVSTQEMIADAPGLCKRPCRVNEIRDGNGDCIQEIPWNCVSWYDGCNTCYVYEGRLGGCTMMMCFTQNEAYCMTYDTGELREGDLCYRFCEDGSRTTINRIYDCPRDTVCSVDHQEQVISIDNCRDGVRKCIHTGH